MMSHSPSSRGRSALTLATALFALVAFSLLAIAGTAHAEEPKGYGELTRFGLPGTKKGQMSETRTAAIGVDPTDNSVYVLDEPLRPTRSEGTLTRTFRLQKFKETAPGEYTATASATVKDLAPVFKGKGEAAPNEPPFEGIAVDPKAKKVYVLGVDAREKSLSQDATLPGEKELLVAATVYAFSTQEAGEKLEGAGKEGPGKEVLASPAAMQAQSTAPGAALLEPRGVTVNPETGNLVILAHTDPNAGKEDHLFKDRYVLAQVNPAGELAGRWTETVEAGGQGFFKSEEIFEGAGTYKPTSPVVVAVGGKDRLEVLYGGLVEAPFEGTAKPTRLSTAPPAEALAQGANGGGLPTGGRLSASPDGTVWGVTDQIKNDSGSGEPHYTGLVAYSGESGSLFGWTGGAPALEPARTQDKCVLEPYVAGGYPQIVAAGSGGKVFALAPEFLLRQIPEEVEVGVNENGEPIFEEVQVPLPGPFFGGVVEFGPGGTGCTGANVSSPVTKVANVEVKEGEAIAPGKAVTLSSHVKQGDALSSEWEFINGSEVKKKTVSANQQQTTKVEETFENEGTYTVKERVYLDDLAAPSQVVYKEGHWVAPSIEVTRTVVISRPHPKVECRGPEHAKTGEEVGFEAEASDSNEKALPLEYSWELGDGSTALGTSARHAFATAGVYTVSVKVTDKLKLSTTCTHTITVTAPEPPPPPTTTTTPPPPPPPPPPHGKGEVLSYKAVLAGSSISVKPSGVLTLTVRCVEGPCAGTVTLTTLSAVAANATASAHKRILTLGGAAFSLAPGQAKAVTVHLNAAGRKLLARVHVLAARATITLRGPEGAPQTTRPVVTLRLKRH